jgi:hypothetical protein
MTTGRCPVCGSNNRKREQQLVDAIFEIAVRMQMGEIKPLSREAAAEYVASQLRALGFDTSPLGMSWGVLN